MSKDERGGRVAPSSRRQPMQTEPGREARGIGEDIAKQDEGLALSQAEREQMLRDDALQNMLPSPPAKKGIHYFWASMTSQGGASVMWYRRLGYRPVRFEELSGWADATMKTSEGDYSGCITVREMILLQCSEEDYQRYMKIIHHDKPNEEARKVKDSLDALRGEVGEDRVESVARKPGEDGFAQMDRETRVRPKPGSSQFE